MHEKIFIVEDEIIVANDIKNILANNGFEVVGVATKYKKALEHIKEKCPDLVLTDINLRNNKNGIQLIEELSSSLHFKVIYITAYSDLETIRKANNTRPSNYITKPFNEQQLITSVQMALLPEIETNSNIEIPTQRELDIIRHLSKGFNNEKIGDSLNISALTVKTHRQNLLKKYDFKNITELVAFAIQNGWV